MGTRKVGRSTRLRKATTRQARAFVFPALVIGISLVLGAWDLELLDVMKVYG